MMSSILACILVALTLVSASASGTRNMEDSSTILIESFENPMHKWQEMNDPVMGGRSTGTFTIEDGLGKFEGEVVDVPYLKAPGFIQVRTPKRNEFYPDVSACTGLEIVAKTNVEYEGYRISFGNAHPPRGKIFAFGYKSDLKGVPMDDFGAVIIPFENFTDYWDDATGDAIVTCKEDPKYCPDRFALKDLKQLSIWGEGKGGKVSLEIKSISAVGCAAVQKE